MLESLIITLREGVEAALIVGITLIYLRKIGRLDLSRWVYGGLFFALGASVLVGIGFRSLEFNEEAFEGVVMLLSGLIVGTMVVWMARTAKRFRGEIERKVEEIAGSNKHEGGSTKQGLGLLVFAFFMVFREGVETVLFLGAVSLNTEGLYTFIGGLAGLGLAVAFGVTFVKGSLRIDLRKFFPITTAVLLVLVFQLFVNGFHELFEAGVLPSTQKEMAIVGPLVRNNLLFLMFILALPLLLLFGKRSAFSVQQSATQSGAEVRTMRALFRKERLWRQMASVATLGVLILLGYNYVYSRVPAELSSAMPVEAVEGKIRIPIDLVEDGSLHRFGYDSGGIFVRFLVMKTGEGQYGCTLDACEICGDQGYYQEGRNVICRNCSADIYIPTIGRSGGCNPIPLDWNREENEIVIEASELEGARAIFNDE